MISKDYSEDTQVNSITHQIATSNINAVQNTACPRKNVVHGFPLIKKISQKRASLINILPSIFKGNLSIHKPQAIYQKDNKKSNSISEASIADDVVRGKIATHFYKVEEGRHNEDSKHTSLKNLDHIINLEQDNSQNQQFTQQHINLNPPTTSPQRESTQAKLSKQPSPDRLSSNHYQPRLSHSFSDRGIGDDTLDGIIRERQADRVLQDNFELDDVDMLSIRSASDRSSVYRTRHESLGHRHKKSSFLASNRRHSSNFIEVVFDSTRTSVIPSRSGRDNKLSSESLEGESCCCAEGSVEIGGKGCEEIEGNEEKDNTDCKHTADNLIFSPLLNAKKASLRHNTKETQTLNHEHTSKSIYSKQISVYTFPHPLPQPPSTHPLSSSGSPLNHLRVNSPSSIATSGPSIPWHSPRATSPPFNPLLSNKFTLSMHRLDCTENIHRIGHLDGYRRDEWCSVRWDCYDDTDIEAVIFSVNSEIKRVMEGLARKYLLGCEETEGGSGKTRRISSFIYSASDVGSGQVHSNQKFSLEILPVISISPPYNNQAQNRVDSSLNLSPISNKISDNYISSPEGKFQNIYSKSFKKHLSDGWKPQLPYFDRLQVGLCEGQDKSAFCKACLSGSGVFYSAQGVQLGIERVKVKRTAEGSPKNGKERIQFDLEVKMEEGMRLVKVADGRGGRFSHYLGNVDITPLKEQGGLILRIMLLPSQMKNIKDFGIETWVLYFSKDGDENIIEIQATLPLTVLTLANVMTPSDKDIQFFSENPHLPRVYWEWQTNHSVSHISNHQLTVRIFVRYVFRGEELAG
jgi:hypothetical protein